MRYPLPTALFSYIGGLLLCTWCPPPDSILFLGAVAGAGLAGRLLMKKACGRMLPLILLPLVLGYAFTYCQIHTAPSNHISRYLTGVRWDLRGTLAKPPEQWTDKVQLIVEAAEISRGSTRHRVAGNVRVSIYDAMPALKAGDYIEVKEALLRAPRNYQNPGSFDYKTYCIVRSIAATCAVGSASRAALIARDTDPGVLRSIYRLKDRMGKSFDEFLPPIEASLLRAMVLGEQHCLPADTEEAFFASGTGHLLAISGLQIGFLAVVWFVMGRLLLRLLLYRIGGATQPLLASRIAALLTVPPIVAYSLMIGAQVSCMRATIMVVTYMAVRLLGRERDIYNTLALAALIILVWKPLALFDIGFQFSFLTVLALVLVNEHTTFFSAKESAADRLRPRARRKIWNHVTAYPKISLVASIVVFPLTAYYFHRLSIVGIAANSIVVPVSLAAVPLGLAASLVSLAWAALGGFLLFCTGWLFSILHACVQWFGALYLSPLLQASIPVHTPPAAALASYYAAVGALVFVRRSRTARLTLAVATAAFLLTIGLKAIPHPQEQLLRVTYLDVGQGDAALIELPDGRRILLDSGGSYGSSFNMGEAVVIPYLHSRWIGKIDMVISSHPQSDHVGGLPPIVKDFDIAEYWESPSALNHNPPELARVMLHPATEHVRRFALDSGNYKTTIEGVEFTVLHPTAAFMHEVYRGGMTQQEVNDTSLVVRVRYGDVSFLFPGDISKRSEAALLPLGDELRATVLKVPHHGSGRSSSPEFIQMVQPAVAVFSVGAHNIFGHPDHEVLARYRRAGARILRTDRDGAITIETDGKTYSIKTFAQTDR